MSKTFEEIVQFYKERDLTMKRYTRENIDKYIHDYHLTIPFPYVHIAGSNGKGSTAMMINDIFVAAKYHVGLFIKPTLHNFLGMVMVDNQEITEEEYTELFNQRYDTFKDRDLTSFEMQVIIAYDYFAFKNVNLAIIECGMGGEKDATNFLDSKPLLSIITSCSLEHQSFLGSNVREIALNKSGIIKQNIPVLLGKMDIEAEKVIKLEARKKSSDVLKVMGLHDIKYLNPGFSFDITGYQNSRILTSAYYELKNVALALSAAFYLRLKFPFDEFALRNGLQNFYLPCRFERIGPFLLDGAHNKDAMKELVYSLKKINLTNLKVVYATFKDKSFKENLNLLKELSKDILLTTFPSSRSATREDYLAQNIDEPYIEPFGAALSQALSEREKEIILVTGSLNFTYLVKEYLEEVMKL